MGEILTNRRGLRKTKKVFNWVEDVKSRRMSIKNPSKRERHFFTDFECRDAFTKKQKIPGRAKKGKARRPQGTGE